MPTDLTLTQIRGPVETPMGEKPAFGRLYLALRAPDREGTTTIAPVVIEIQLDAEGDFARSVWANLAGETKRPYAAWVEWWSDRQGKSEQAPLGYVSVPLSGPTYLANLWTADVVDFVPADILATCIAAQESALLSAAAASGFADRAETAAIEAALYDGPKVDTFAELATVTPAMLPVGGFIRVISIGAVYQHVLTGGHLDYSGSGGVKLKVLPGADGRYSAKALGVIGDGTTDDTAAFEKARSAALGRPLVIDGILNISSPQTISTREHWIFTGHPGNSSGARPKSFLKKMPSVSGPLVTINWSNTQIDNGGILGVSGNVGDGYLINANGVVMNMPYVEGCGRDGIRVGADVSGNNTNSVFLNRPTSKFNGRYGIYLSDGGPGLPSNANSGTIIAPSVSNNGSHGIIINWSAWWTIINPLCQANAGYGIYLAGIGGNNTIIGGDTELNPGGDLYQADPKSNKIYNLNIGGNPYSTDMAYPRFAPGNSDTNLIGNNEFSSSDVWDLTGTASISAGSLFLPAGSSGEQRFETIPGATYRVKVHILTSGTRGVVRVGTVKGGSNLVSAGYITTTGIFYYTFKATTQNTWLTLFHDSGGTGTIEIDYADVRGNIVSGGSVLSASDVGGVGYAAGAGGAAVQTGSKTAGVSLNKMCGSITMHGASLAAGATESFTLTVADGAFGAADQLILNHASGGTFGGYVLNARRTGATTFAIDVTNRTAGALAEAIVLQYSVFRSVAA